jgi:hypothetical protein
MIQACLAADGALVTWKKRIGYAELGPEEEG